ncbi:matrix metalloproteinase-23 isoform X4 [Tursiops truncatus]|uniref:matrix metalloproteinase-23 isoform X4 n=1 Tax=Tursiops truncatus TaxID=9739 RepID=UPI003CCF514B
MTPGAPAPTQDRSDFGPARARQAAPGGDSCGAPPPPALPRPSCAVPVALHGSFRWPLQVLLPPGTPSLAPQAPPSPSSSARYSLATSPPVASLPSRGVPVSQRLQGTCPELAGMQVPLPGLIRCPGALRLGEKLPGAMGRGACVPSAASGAHDRARLLGAVLGALCLLPTLVLLARPGALGNRPVASAAQLWLGVENQKMPKDKGVPPWRERQRSLERAPSHPSRSISSRLGDSPCCLPTGHLLPSKGDAVPPTAGVLTTPSLGPPHPPAPRRRRYTLTPTRLHWDHFNLTYRILSFPRNLLSPRETRRGLAAAFRMWSDVSPFSFREVAPEQPSDLRIGFYPVNHTDCLVSPTHHCFDGPTGELAHAFFPPHGGIHFDDSEYWVLGPTRYSWKKGVWLTDLVHVAAHEIGHALGLMHSQHGRALMHLNATLRGWKALSQDELWGLHRLYGCLDRLFVCASWARRGFCDARQRLMKRLCPSSCDFCYEFPFPTVAATAPPPRTKTRLVPEGRNVTFRCGQKILHKKGKVYWYKDQEPLEFSYPGYLALGDAHLSIIANAINEGTYTCVVRRRQHVLSTYSWRVRLRS